MVNHDFVRMEKRRKGKVMTGKKVKTIACVASEHFEQAALVQWWGHFSRTKGLEERLLFAVPNGGARDAITGARLKAEGVRPGVPDLMLALPRGGKGGLFIEMKRKRAGRPSKAQIEVSYALLGAGYHVALCRGADEAMNVIKNYLGAK